MEKRGLKFFVLHTLASQLQRWANFLSRQIDDEQRSILQDEERGEKTEEENRSLSTSVSTEDAIMDVDIDGPPAHWLARVQKDAPDLLSRMQHSRQSNAKTSHPLPARQMLNTTRVAETRQRPPLTEISRTETASHSSQQNTQITDHPDQLNTEIVIQPAPPTPAGSGNAEASNTTRNLSLPATSPLGSQSITVKSSELFDTNIENLPTSRPLKMTVREVPVYQPEAARTEKRPSFPGQEVAIESYLQPPPRPLYTPDLNATREISKSEKTGRQKHGTQEISRQFEPGQQPGVPYFVWPEQTNEVAPPHFVTLEENQETERGSEGERNKSLLFSTVQEDLPTRLVSPRREKDLETHPFLQVQSNSWQSTQVSSARFPGYANEYSQAEMSWPTLPDEIQTGSQDWEMARRLWERRQRLDEEQRGNSWSV